MRSFNKYFLKILGGFLFSFSALKSFAQDAAEPAAPAVAEPAGAGFVFDVNTVLGIVVIILFLVLAVLAYTLKNSMELYKYRVRKEKENNSGNAAKVITMVAGLIVFSALGLNAQTDAAATTTKTAFGQSDLLRYLLLFIIFLELVAIFAVIKWLRFFTGIEELQVSKGKQSILSMSFKGWWRRFNKFKPIREEADIDMGHSYDGIRELDNVLPPWFTWSFVGTIIFAIVYMWRFHASANPAPDQYQEFENAMVKAKLAQEAYIAAKGGEIDENTVVMLGASEIAEGSKLFQSNCVACHGAEGQGTIGPNLTDDYWIHGGKIGDVFRTIKVGVIEKGMQSWKDVFSATQIAQLSSYIKSIHGTNPAGAKAPEGDIYKEEAGATAPAADSTAAAPAPATADSSAAN